jgi:molybdopterin synthase sulfur carrier subunit
MAVTVKFFASVREAVGVSSESLAVPDGVTTVGALRDHLAARGDNWRRRWAIRRCAWRTIR